MNLERSQDSRSIYKIIFTIEFKIFRDNFNGKCVRCLHKKTTEHCWEKLKIYINGEEYQFHAFEDSSVLPLNWSLDWVESHQNPIVLLSGNWKTGS